MTDDSKVLFESFAEAMSALEKLTKIESKLSTALASSKVPWKETRKMLKCSSSDELSNTPLFQFMRGLFQQIGLGHFEITGVSIFQHNYMVKSCKISKLYPTIKDKKICYIVVDALSQFYSRDLSLPNSVEEVKCVKTGDDCCQFQVDLQPLAVYQMALDEGDKRLIGSLIEAKASPEDLVQKLQMEDAEIRYRMDILKSYQILDENENITEIGETFYKYGHGPLREVEEDFDPPWKTQSEISTAIAATTSFAEAFTETTQDEPLYEVDENEIINLAEEAKKSRGFAELLAKQVKKDHEKS